MCRREVERALGILSVFKKKAEERRPFCTAVVPAAGNASRMQGIDKILAFMGDRPVLAHTLTALNNCPRIDEIIVATREDLIVPISNLCKDYGLDKVKTIVKGGKDRAESIRNGLQEASPQRQLVAIHDGARPLVSQELLDEVIQTAAKTGAAAPACPIKDTVKRSFDGHIVKETVDRSQLYGVQTPQVFDADFISAALQYCEEHEIAITDDCSAAEVMGKQVILTQGSYENIKITTPVDLIIGEAILKWREQH